jgi:long-chain fatty acid transport protein
VTIGAPVITFDLNYTNQGSTSVLGLPLSGPSAINGGRTSGLMHAYGVWKLNDRWAVGLGFTPPYGLGNDYGDTWVGRYHATRSELAVLNFNPAIAYKIHKNLSLGFGLDVQRSTSTLANRLDFGSFGAALGLPMVPQMVDGGITFDASDWGVGIDASAAWQVTPRVRLATTYRSMVEHTLAGTATFDVPEAAMPLAVGGFHTTPAATTLLMPHELSIAGALALSRRWTLVADFTWTDWSQFQELTLSFENVAQAPVSQRADFRDTKRGAVGLVFEPHGRWVVRV